MASPRGSSASQKPTAPTSKPEQTPPPPPPPQQREGAVEGFHRTMVGRRILFGIVAMTVVLAASIWGYQASRPEELPCARMGDEAVTLQKGSELEFSLPPKGCWTPWLLRPPKAKGFQYAADATITVDIAYVDRSTCEFVNDPKFRDVDQKLITAVRFKNDRSQVVLLRLFVK